jgi:hypothetical protein
LLEVNERRCFRRIDGKQGESMAEVKVNFLHCGATVKHLYFSLHCAVRQEGIVSDTYGHDVATRLACQ